MPRDMCEGCPATTQPTFMYPPNPGYASPSGLKAES